MEWYNPIRFTTWPRMNNRTHRELLIVDGSIGFIGGAGWADHWYKRRKKQPRWRDTMVRVEGDGPRDCSRSLPRTGWSPPARSSQARNISRT